MPCCPCHGCGRAPYDASHWLGCGYGNHHLDHRAAQSFVPSPVVRKGSSASAHLSILMAAVSLCLWGIFILPPPNLLPCQIVLPVSWPEHHKFPDHTLLWMISSSISSSVLVGHSFVLLWSLGLFSHVPFWNAAISNLQVNICFFPQVMLKGCLISPFLALKSYKDCYI